MRGPLKLLPQITVLSIVAFLFLFSVGLIDGRVIFSSPNRTFNVVADTHLIAVSKTVVPEPTVTCTPHATQTPIPATISTPTLAIVPNARSTAQLSSPLLRIGGTIWSDSNRDGIRDRTERGIQEILVDLYAPKFEWIAGTESDANGEYFFDVPPGEYIVVIEIPSVYISTLDSEDTYHPERWIDDRDNGLGTKGDVITSHPFLLASDLEAEHTIDFGLQEAAIDEDQSE